VRRGARRQLVSLSQGPTAPGDSDGFFSDLSPRQTFAAIEPVSPVSADGTRIGGHFVTIDYHPQVTVDTRLTFTDRNGTARELFVKGVQNVGLRDREMRLYCEEAL